MKISDRMDHLEALVSKHLEESGEIRADLKWLKKVMWFVLGTPLVSEALRHIWK